MTDRTIQKFVKKVRRKLRRQCIFGALCSSLFVGILVACFFSLLSMWIPFYYASRLEILAIGCSVVVGSIKGILETPSIMQAALAADALGYQEKISTALYLQGREDTFSRLQRRDALQAIQQIEIKKAFPLRYSKRKMCGLFAVVLLFAVSCFVDSPVRQTARQQHELKQEVKEEIAKVRKVQKELQEQKDVSKQEVTQLNKQLEQIKEELAKVDSQANLQKTKERSIKKLQQTAQNLNDSKLRERMQAMTQAAQEEQEKQKQRMAENAQKALEQAKDGNKKEKEAAYEAVKKYAQANSNSNLEKKIQDYKDSGYSDADYVRAGAALDEAVENGSQYASNHSSSDSTDDNRQTTGNNRSQSGATQGTSSGDKQSGAQSQGQQQGQQNASGGTKGTNGNNGNSGSGGTSGQQGGAGWNRGSDTSKEREAKTAENVTIPDGELGQDENLTGKANGNENTQKVTSAESNAWSGNKVNYGQVSGTYKKKAYKQIDGASYPYELKKQIRNYFDGLN